MPKHRRLNLKLLREPVASVSRAATNEVVIVYIFVADKKLEYKTGKRSKIVYIGKTESGISRVADSAAERTDTIFKVRGVYSFEARVVHYPSEAIDRRHTWLKEPPILLERALIIEFTEMYGEPPLCNGTGSGMRAEFGEFEKFSRSRIQRIIEDLS